MLSHEVGYTADPQCDHCPHDHHNGMCGKRIEVNTYCGCFGRPRGDNDMRRAKAPTAVELEDLGDGRSISRNYTGCGTCDGGGCGDCANQRRYG